MSGCSAPPARRVFAALLGAGFGLAGFDEPARFGILEIVARTRHKKPPTETPESAAFLEIVDVRPDSPSVQVFTGWMSASSPAVSALEHPVYDVWGIECRMIALPAEPPEAEAADAPFYAPEAAQEPFAQHQEELDITMAPAQDMAYVEDRAQYLLPDEIPLGMEARRLSDAEIRRRLDAGLETPEWYAFPEVVAELEKACPARHRQGFVAFVTGLSGAGKSTVANALMVTLERLGSIR